MCLRVCILGGFSPNMSIWSLGKKENIKWNLKGREEKVITWVDLLSF